MSVEKTSPAQEANTMQSEIPEDVMKAAQDAFAKLADTYGSSAAMVFPIARAIMTERERHVSTILTGEMIEAAKSAYSECEFRTDEQVNSSITLIVRAALEAALSTDAEPVAEIVAQRDALIAAGLKCCDGTPNPNLRPFDLAMSFIDSTNTARKAADTLWQEYKAELDALRSSHAEPVKTAPAVAVKALADAYQKYLDASALYNERLAIAKTKAPGTMRVDDERKAIDDARRAFDKLAVEVATTSVSAQVQDVATFQQRVEAAHHALFHDDPTDIEERNARCFEESIETAQAFGMTEDEAIALVKYTFSRPVGEPAKELGAKVLTAFSLGVIAGIDVMAAAEADLDKLQRPETIARIRAKRSTRHGRGPLPGFDPASPASKHGDAE